MIERLREIQDSLESAAAREANRDRGYQAVLFAELLARGKAIKWIADLQEEVPCRVPDRVRQGHLKALQRFVNSNRRKANEAKTLGVTVAWYRLSKDADLVEQSYPELTKSEQAELARMNGGE